VGVFRVSTEGLVSRAVLKAGHIKECAFVMFTFHPWRRAASGLALVLAWGTASFSLVLEWERRGDNPRVGAVDDKCDTLH
jgi:hypothetical protein